jgi:hypothetical protein
LLLLLAMGMLREWSDGSGACCTRAWGTMRVLVRVLKRDGGAVLLLMGEYETVSLPVLRMEPVLRLMTWVIAHPVD